MQTWAVGVYNERNGKNEVKIIDADLDIRAMQKAVDGYFFDTDDTTIVTLQVYYWESKQIVVSNPVLIK